MVNPLTGSASADEVTACVVVTASEVVTASDVAEAVEEDAEEEVSVVNTVVAPSGVGDGAGNRSQEKSQQVLRHTLALFPRQQKPNVAVQNFPGIISIPHAVESLMGSFVVVVLPMVESFTVDDTSAIVGESVGAKVGVAVGADDNKGKTDGSRYS